MIRQTPESLLVISDCVHQPTGKSTPFALAHYEASIKTIRDSKYPLDAKFKKRIAKDYARLLRKSGDSKKAKLILKEFCSKPGKLYGKKV